MPDVPEITTHELAEALEARRPLQVLDVRAPHRLAAGAIATPEPRRFFNVPGSQLFAAGNAQAAGLDPAVPVAVVCGHGNSSRAVTQWLAAQGYDARSVQGGMAAWMHTAIPRRLAAPPGFDALIQFDRLGKGALGYVLVSGDEAVVIDPPRNVEPYLTAIADAGARLVAALDTHAHADYISGGPGLHADLGVPYRLHPADAVYPYDGTPGRIDYAPLADGDRIAVGRGTLTAMHTPGHTEGSVTFLVGDAVAFTGDFVFVRSVGRPDLAGKQDTWTDDLWRSLERARAEWSADLEVRPAHYLDDAERLPDRSVGGRFAALVAHNEPLALRDATAFRRWVLERTREAPSAYQSIKAINVGLLAVTGGQADELEGGKSECAV